MLCSESKEDELSLRIGTPEVQEEDILLFSNNLLKSLKRKKEIKREDKNKTGITNMRAKRFRSVCCQMRQLLEGVPM